MQVEEGVRTRVKSPLTGAMIRAMEAGAAGLGKGGRILWIGVALSYLLMARASELFAGGGGKYDETDCPQGKDVDFSRGNTQLGAGERATRTEWNPAQRIQRRPGTEGGSLGENERRGEEREKEEAGAVELLTELLGGYEGRG